MSPENVQEESAPERSPAAFRVRSARTGPARPFDHFPAAVDKDAASAPPANRVVAFKFGGSSLLGAERMLHAAGLARRAARSSSVAVVVSAMKGVTDDLHLGEGHDLRVRRELQLLGRDLLHEVPVQGFVAASAELFDRLASFGERFSARLFAAALEKLGIAAVPVASSEFVLTCDTFRDAQPHLEQTKQRGREILLPLLHEGIMPVVTGFIGSTPDGRITTLGRNSSDFSGAIIAHVIDADELVIWTDVDGIYTANPSESGE